MKREQKLKVVKGALSEVKGIFKGVFSSIIADLKIGQLVLLDRVLQDKTAIKDLQKVFTAIDEGKTHEQITADLQDKIKGTGFKSANSLINFGLQLKEDQAMNLQGSLEEEGSLKDLHKAIAYLLDHYEYTT